MTLATCKTRHRFEVYFQFNFWLIKMPRNCNNNKSICLPVNLAAAQLADTLELRVLFRISIYGAICFYLSLTDSISHVFCCALVVFLFLFVSTFNALFFLYLYLSFYLLSISLSLFSSCCILISVLSIYFCFFLCVNLSFVSDLLCLSVFSVILFSRDTVFSLSVCCFRT